MSTKLNWNNQEEQLLRQIVENKKDLTWNEIAIEMNRQFPEKYRTGKQYRERYVNYVQFEQNSKKNNNWSVEEEQVLFRSYRELGTKWTLIAKIIPSKSQNSLKNKFYGALRKTLRKINRMGKQNIKKFNKLIRYESLIRIMDAAEGAQDLPCDIKINSQRIKQKILIMAEHCESEFNLDEVGDIIKQIHRFNIATRCYSSKKWKRNNCQEKEIKVEQSESSGISQEKTSKQSRRFKNSIKSVSTQTIKLQQNGRSNQENNQIKIQVQQPRPTFTVKLIQIQDIEIKSLIKNNGLPQQKEFQSSSEDVHNDLDFDLCGILHQNYIPQHFNYFQQ